jgi:hypothetical protein
MSWWLSALSGGVAVLLITAVRAFVVIIADGLDGIDWGEVLGVMGLAFAGGCVFGLLLWAFQWLKWRFTRSRR